MKLSSVSVLDITKKMLGLDDIQPKLLEKSLDFETGRALLIGRWAQDSPQLLYYAARRTIEGGRNLREDHWASSYEPRKRTTRSKTSKSPKVKSIVKSSVKSAEVSRSPRKQSGAKNPAK